MSPEVASAEWEGGRRRCRLRQTLKNSIRPCLRDNLPPANTPGGFAIPPESPTMLPPIIRNEELQEGYRCDKKTVLREII